MFRLDEPHDEPHGLRLARVTIEHMTLWSWLCQYPPTEELGVMLKALPVDATLHDILFTRQGVTFVIRGSGFPEVKADAPLPWLLTLIGEEADGPCPKPGLECRCGLMVFEFQELPFYRCHGCFRGPQDCPCPPLGPGTIPESPDPGPLPGRLEVIPDAHLAAGG